MNESALIWDQLASWWDKSLGDGDTFRHYLINPFLKKLFTIQKGQSILDIGCGNGSLVKYLYQKDCFFTACDVSPNMIELARARCDGLDINFHVVDATHYQDLIKLRRYSVSGGYDLIVSSMVMHDLDTLDPLIQSLNVLLNKDGAFIFSILHPAFNSLYTIFNEGQEPNLIITGYATSTYRKEKGKHDQPIGHYMYHRTLSSIFQKLLDANLVLTCFEEPVLNEKDLPKLSNFFWAKYRDIPPIIIAKWERK